ncbi:MAG: hypothetical protein WB816_11360 [Methylocystis sp.]
MDAPRKEFGKRAIKPPAVITHAPQGLGGGPAPLAARQMRTLAITLGLVGATAIGVFAVAQAHNRRVNCAPPEGSNPNGQPCPSSSGSSGHGGSGFWSRSSGYSGPSGYPGASSAAHGAVSFGGFGHAGAAHGGGGGE